MAKLTPDEFVDKHARRLKGSIDDMRRGIERVTVAPTQQAAGKKDKMLARLTQSVNDGKWEAGLKRVTLDDWKSSMIEKGLVRVSGGIDKAAPKVRDFASQLLPHIDNVKAQVDKMPDLTIEDSINRMNAFTRGMAKFRKK